MKTLAIRLKIGLVLSLVATGVIGWAVYGQDTPTPSPNDSIHLVMGGKDKEPLHVSEDSLKAALKGLDVIGQGNGYKVQYWKNGKLQPGWPKEKGTLDLCQSGNMDGSVAATNDKIMSGSHSTQQVTFTSSAVGDSGLMELQAFVKALTKP